LGQLLHLQFSLPNFKLLTSRIESDHNSVYKGAPVTIGCAHNTEFLNPKDNPEQINVQYTFSKLQNSSVKFLES